MKVTLYVPKELEETYKILQKAADEQRVGIFKYLLRGGEIEVMPETDKAAYPEPTCPWCQMPLDIAVTVAKRKKQGRPI